jgi:tetratricopeptide (TPR) repeat protein
MANRARTAPGAQKVETIQANPLDNVQVYYEKNKNRINTIIFLVIVVVVGFFGYERLYKAPREDKAATAVSFAQRYFEADSLNLNGDGQHLGFLAVIKRYDGTTTANLCHYYAGICYLHGGQYANAIKYLKDFDGKGTLVAYAAYGAMGDAYMEMGNTKSGIEYYNKASENKDDLMLTPLYLYRAGIAYEMNNQPDEAKKCYERIRDDYPRSMQARDMDKALARLGELN